MALSRSQKTLLVFFLAFACLSLSGVEAWSWSNGSGWGWGSDGSSSSSSGPVSNSDGSSWSFPRWGWRGSDGSDNSGSGSGWGWGSDASSGSGSGSGSNSNGSSGSWSFPRWGWNRGSDGSSGLGSGSGSNSRGSGWGWGSNGSSGWGSGSGTNPDGSRWSWNWNPKSGWSWSCGSDNNNLSRSGSGSTLVADNEAPKKIAVGGSDGWTKGLNYKEWTSKNAPFYIDDVLVFKYDETAERRNNVYLFQDPWSYMNCDMKNAKKIGSTNNESKESFNFTLNNIEPYFFASGEHYGDYCSNHHMKFTVFPIPHRSD